MAQPKSILFTPQPETAGETQTQPSNDVLTLGHMIEDAALLRTKLRKLPHATDGFRGELRVIQTTALRIHRAATRLLGEEVSA